MLTLGGMPAERPEYDRKQYFLGWVDTDGDGLDTRGEILERLNVGNLIRSDDGHSIERGKWFGAFSGRAFTNADDVEIDHLVPLKWAWDHGAWLWTQEERARFELDEQFLLIVQKELNREKGAKSPIDWLPRTKRVRCGYVLRFERAISLYGLRLSRAEVRDLAATRAAACGGAGVSS